MAYQKHGSGNDYKKGNRTRGPDRRGGRPPEKGTIPENLEAINKRTRDLAAMTDYYRELAATKEKQIKYNMAYLTRAFIRISDYIDECEKTKTPVTIAGCQLAGEIMNDAWYAIGAGDMDYLLPLYMDVHDIPESETGTIYCDPDTGENILLLQPSEMQNRVLLKLQDQLERNCYTNKGNPVGSIFGLKARFNWQDQPDTAAVRHNTLIIADAGQARKAMELLTKE